jgi:hypothetical protein
MVLASTLIGWLLLFADPYWLARVRVVLLERLCGISWMCEMQVQRWRA